MKANTSGNQHGQELSMVFSQLCDKQNYNSRGSTSCITVIDINSMHY